MIVLVNNTLLCPALLFHAQLFKAAVQRCEKWNVPVAAGVAAPTTAQAVLLAKAAMSAGCVGVLLGLPPYIRLCDEEMREYIAAVRDVIPTQHPVLLYNNAARNGYGPSDLLVLELFRNGDICGMKYAVLPNDLFLRSSVQLLQQEPALRLYTGSDKLALQLLDASPNAMSDIAPTDGATNGKECVMSGGTNEADFDTRPLLRPLYYGLTSIVGNLCSYDMGRAVMSMLSSPAERSIDAELQNQRLVQLMDEVIMGSSLPVGVKYAMNIAGITGTAVTPVAFHTMNSYIHMILFVIMHLCSVCLLFIVIS